MPGGIFGRKAAAAQPHSRRSILPALPTSLAVRNTLNSRGYVLGKTLGTGTYGKVKFAHSLRLKRAVAVKIVSRKVAKEVHRKFLPREMEALQTLRHKNIIELIECVETQDHIYIVMELAEGGDLLDYINKKKHLTDGDSCGFFHDIVDGLTECHRMNFVHRDLKCENMLLDRNSNVKISDFGFARKFIPFQKLDTYCGSYAYAAPEVILGQPYYGPLADIWSIGVILYAMMCGKLPFRDKNTKRLLKEVANGIDFSRKINETCKELIKGILKLNPKERLTLGAIKTHTWMVHNRPMTTVEAMSTTPNDIPKPVIHYIVKPPPHHGSPPIPNHMPQPVADPVLSPVPNHILPVTDCAPPPIPPRTYKRTCVLEETTDTVTITTSPPPLPPRTYKRMKQQAEPATCTSGSVSAELD